MKKKFVLALLALSLSFFLPWLMFSHSGGNTPPFTCETNFSQSSFWQNNKAIPIVINATQVISLVDNEHGFFIVRGTVETNGNIYALSRQVNFNSSSMILNGMKKITFTKELTRVTDNTPDEIWQNYFMPQKLGVDFHVNMVMLNDNTMFIKSFTSPYLICVIKN